MATETTGQKIKQARLERMMTQSELARTLGVESVTVSRWERDVVPPSQLNVYRLADALGLPGGYFLDGRAA